MPIRWRTRLLLALAVLGLARWLAGRRRPMTAADAAVYSDEAERMQDA
jgi:hypothetical protein